MRGLIDLDIKHKSLCTFPVTSKTYNRLDSTVLDVSNLALLEAQASALGILAEFLLGFLDLEHDDGVGLAARLDLEESVHGLERNGLGLGNEEVDENNGQQHHASEEEVDTATGLAHVEEHLRSESGNDEVL